MSNDEHVYILAPTYAIFNVLHEKSAVAHPRFFRISIALGGFPECIYIVTPVYAIFNVKELILMRFELPDHLRDYAIDCYGTNPMQEIIDALNRLPDIKKKELLSYLTSRTTLNDKDILECQIQNLSSLEKRHLVHRLIDEL